MNQKALRHEIAFADFVAMGPERSLPKVAERYAVSEAAVKKWSIKNHWAERVAQIDKESAAKALAKAEETLLDMNVRHIQISKATQAAYVDKLKKKTVNPTPSDAVQMIKLERAIRGSPVPEDPDKNLQGAEIGDIDSLVIEETRRLTATRKRASPTP